MTLAQVLLMAAVAYSSGRVVHYHAAFHSYKFAEMTEAVVGGDGDTIAHYTKMADRAAINWTDWVYAAAALWMIFLIAFF